MSGATAEEFELVHDEAAAFYAQHLACGPKHAILVTMFLFCDCDDDECSGVTTDCGVFSTFDGAVEWRATFSDEWESMFTPVVIDNPDYGPRGAVN